MEDRRACEPVEPGLVFPGEGVAVLILMVVMNGVESALVSYDSIYWMLLATTVLLASTPVSARDEPVVGTYQSQPRRARGRPRLLIVTRECGPYRVPLYNRLVTEGADVSVLSGISSRPDRARQLQAAIFGELTFRHSLRLGRLEHYLLPHGLRFAEYDAIICQLTARVPVTVWWSLGAKLARVPFFWWGHSKDFQSRTFISRLSDRWKLAYTRWSAGFLAYTEEERQRLIARGFAPEKVVALGNTVDTDELARWRDLTTQADVEGVLKQSGLESRQLLGFIGRVYPLKRLDFALEAFARLKKERADLGFVVIGDGPDRAALEARYGRIPGVRFLGAVYDPAILTPWLKAMTVVLNPGVVGLNLIQPFLFEKPVVTVVAHYHS